MLVSFFMAVILLAFELPLLKEAFISPVYKYTGKGLVYQRMRVGGVGGVLSPLYRLVFGLVTPFPWTNITESVSLFQVLGELAAYAQNVLTLALLYIVVRAAWAAFTRKRLFTIPVSAVLGILTIIAGCFGYAIHNTYVQVGSVFLIPYALEETRTNFSGALFFSFCFFIVLNVFWLLVRGFI